MRQPLVDIPRFTVPAGAEPSRWRMLVSGSATPHRLRRLGAVLVAGCLATALLSMLTGSVRTDAVGAGGTRIAALATDTTQLYRSLNEADAMASSGFASGGTEPATVRSRYDDHVARAAARLVHAAGLLPPGGRDAASVELIAGELPHYTALVEAARSLAGQGSPLAREPVDSASELMRSTILPAADGLRLAQAAALGANYRQASAFPVAVLLVAAATLLGICVVAVLERRRTNRILNPGLVAAGVLVAAALLWWLGTALAVSATLDAAQEHNDLATALDDTRVTVLQARAAETLALVDDGGRGGSGEEVSTRFERLLGIGGLLDVAADRAPGDAASATVAAIRDAATGWQDAHGRLRVLDAGGDRQAALASAVGADPQGSGTMFDRLNAALANALGAEQTALAADVRSADRALSGLAEGPGLLALLAAGAAAAGISRRVREYR